MANLNQASSLRPYKWHEQGPFPSPSWDEERPMSLPSPVFLKTWCEPVTRTRVQPSRSRRRMISRLLASKGIFAREGRDYFFFFADFLAAGVTAAGVAAGC